MSHDPSAEKDALDKISAARLMDTLVEWASRARQEALDLAFDAPRNPGIESLEEPAEEATEALQGLLGAARALEGRAS